MREKYSELQAVWKQVKALQQLAPEAFHTAILQVAHRYWSDEQDLLSKEDLRMELRTDAGMSTSVQAQFEAVLT